MTPPLIQVENLRRHYQMGDTTVRAVDDVSFHIDKGEYVAIVGSSGSGKTTLMNMLGCLAKPTSGTYTLAGKNVAELGDDELSGVRSEYIGFVFQNFQLLPKQSALKNVELPLVYRDVSPKDRQELAAEALKQVGLGSAAEVDLSVALLVPATAESRGDSTVVVTTAGGALLLEKLFLRSTLGNGAEVLAGHAATTVGRWAISLDCH